MRPVHGPISCGIRQSLGDLAGAGSGSFNPKSGIKASDASDLELKLRYGSFTSKSEVKALDPFNLESKLGHGSSSCKSELKHSISNLELKQGHGTSTPNRKLKLSILPIWNWRWGMGDPTPNQTFNPSIPPRPSWAKGTGFNPKSEVKTFDPSNLELGLGHGTFTSKIGNWRLRSL